MRDISLLALLASALTTHTLQTEYVCVVVAPFFLFFPGPIFHPVATRHMAESSHTN